MVRTGRNVVVATGTGGVLAWLLSYPTSTGRDVRPAAAPAASVVVEPTGDVVVTGPPIPTEYGPVQVLARLRGGRLAATRAVVYPAANIVDAAINADALPQLDRSALMYGDGRVDTVTQATATSAGYRGSLQAALDALDAADAIGSH